MMKVVGVIGAGAAGLCAARHVSASSCMTPIVWEKSSRVGGTWVYTPQVGKDEHGLPIHSSMYKNLKTNLPKELMAFPDYSFPDKEESFVHHTDVLSYLEDYAAHNNLHQYIKFCHHVKEVKPVKRDDGTTGWAVTVQDLETKTTTTTLCDSIMVCNGHYSVPNMPAIKGIDKFRGIQIHSHDYREPEPFTGLRVVMFGAGASGVDISLEVATVAKEVILSHNHPIQIPSELPANIRQVRGVVEANENGFVFGDGTQADADAIMYCTGYQFTFPFLSEECEVTVEDNIVKPLYKHVIHTAYPSMAFIGIPFHVVPFPLFDMQVQFFLSSLKQDMALPGKTSMDQDTQAALVEHIDKGQAIRHFHRFSKDQWKCNKDLATMSGTPPLPQFLTEMHSVVIDTRQTNLMSYKKMQFRLTGSGTFQRIK